MIITLLPKLSALTDELITLWIFSAAVSALSAPDDKSSQLYAWVYRFLHLLAANLDRAGLLEPRSGDPRQKATGPHLELRESVQP